MTQQAFSIWDGVFNNFAETNCDLDVHSDKLWINKQKNKIATQLELLENNKLLSSSAISRDYPLSIVVAMLIAQQDIINIVDFGGGMGSQYLELMAKIPSSINKIHFHIIENEATIQNLPTKMQQFTNLTFATDLHKSTKHTDIVHIGSALHYINDWQGLLQSLFNIYSPKYLVLSDLLAGNIPTFVSCQLYYGTRIPVRMFNLANIISFIETFGSQHIYQALYEVELLGQKTLANSALPEQYRISNTVNLIFYNEGSYGNA
jgi:putative methyltransferase (TIGR04325 family)